MTNGPSNIGQACYFVMPIMANQYPIQIAVGTRISARRYLYGSWSAWT